jgi:uncharacterized protein (DUF302 family)
MEYYFSKIISGSFDEAVERATVALKAEGFGIISEINIHEKLQEKLGVEFKKYRILGACNPGYAYKALQAEDKIGTMLPCNVTVIDREDGTIEIAAVNPLASMMAIHNPALEPIALEVTEKLKRAVELI